VTLFERYQSFFWKYLILGFMASRLKALWMYLMALIVSSLPLGCLAIGVDWRYSMQLLDCFLAAIKRNESGFANRWDGWTRE